MTSATATIASIRDRALSDTDELAPGVIRTNEVDADDDDDDDSTLHGEGEIDIEEDDIDDTHVPSVTGDVRPPAQAGLQTLPSYQALMSSLGSGVAAGAAVGARVDDDPDENHGYLEDDSSTVDGSVSDSDDDLDLTSPVGAGGVPAHSFEEMFSKAKKLETKGKTRKAGQNERQKSNDKRGERQQSEAFGVIDCLLFLIMVFRLFLVLFPAHYYLYCLEQYRYSNKHQDLIALCLRRMGDICYKSRKYKEALQFRTAERMVYESNLLRIVRTEADKEAAEIQAAAASAGNSTANSPRHISDSASSPTAASSVPHKHLELMRMKSADPTPIIRTPITPKELIQEEEKALTYERLAKLFYDEKNVEMAKSYALKAIELRRRIRGQPHTTPHHTNT